MTDWIQRLGRWRTVFAGWQLGTRSKDDPECQAVRDHRELTMMLRAEVNAMAMLLIENRIFSAKEWDKQVQKECQLLCEGYEKRFPGFKATDEGLEIDTEKSLKTTRGWKP